MAGGKRIAPVDLFSQGIAHKNGYREVIDTFEVSYI
jgi:hypothetical protein